MEIILAVVGLMASALGFYVKQLYGRLDKLESHLQTHLVEDAAKYIPRAEMNEFADRIRSDVQAIVQPMLKQLQSIEEHLRNRPS